jgi:hypothetical protein
MAPPLFRSVGIALTVSAVSAIPADPYNFTQIVDHFASDSSTFQQRYYKNETWFGGPGVCSYICGIFSLITMKAE